mmetsp:Transcript_101561/g.296044  ORF Transcript_101561/g.296044 Transcript_101561/m.296044 type:complete len:245 (-) Transcript_101561:7-741(-)
MFGRIADRCRGQSCVGIQAVSRHPTALVPLRNGEAWRGEVARPQDLSVHARHRALRGAAHPARARVDPDRVPGREPDRPAVGSGQAPLDVLHGEGVDGVGLARPDVLGSALHAPDMKGQCRAILRSELEHLQEPVVSGTRDGGEQRVGPRDLPGGPVQRDEHCFIVDKSYPLRRVATAVRDSQSRACTVLQRGTVAQFWEILAEGSPLAARHDLVNTNPSAVLQHAKQESGQAWSRHRASDRRA